MSGSVKKRGALFGAALGVGTTLVLVMGFGVFAGVGGAASASAPKNTSPPTITGTPQQGNSLVGHRGTWTEKPTDYNDFWMRCDKDGGSCSDISGANNKAGYLLKPSTLGTRSGSRCRPRTRRQHLRLIGADRGDRCRRAAAASAASAGDRLPDRFRLRPGGRRQAAGSAADRPQQSSPSVVHAGSQQIILRYHVSACGGRSVQGALVYATATPYNQLSTPGEQTTGADGFAELSFQHAGRLPGQPEAAAARDVRPGTQVRRRHARRHLHTPPVLRPGQPEGLTAPTTTPRVANPLTRGGGPKRPDEDTIDHERPDLMNAQSRKRATRRPAAGEVSHRFSLRVLGLAVFATGLAVALAPPPPRRRPFPAGSG